MSSPERQDFRLVHRLRVRWAEVDQQRIVFNPHYLMYLDTAFTEYWRALAIPYDMIPTMLGGDMYVKKSTLEYHGSARLDDLLDVGLKCQRIGNSSLLFVGGVFRGDTLLVSAEMLYVFADPQTQTSRPVPKVLRDLFDAFEAGAPTFDIRLGAWTDLGDRAGPLRRTVFMEELGIPAQLDVDSSDDSAVHALVTNKVDQPLATGRLAQEAPGVGRIARVAVAHTMRSTGIGRVLVEALLKAAAQRGDTRVLLRSQASAEGFYTRLGFAAIAGPTMEAGIPQVEMARDIGKG